MQKGIIGPKLPNFSYLEGIQNFHFSSNFDADILFQLIVTRASGTSLFPLSVMVFDCFQTGAERSHVD